MSAPEPTLREVWGALLRGELRALWDPEARQEAERKRRANLRDGNPDNFTWREGLGARLPQGLEVWKGVNFAYEALMADTALWRTSDANCCPTGGEAHLDFEIRDDRLTLTGVQVNDALTSLAQQVPAGVFAWVQRRMACDHWGGEEPYDAERAAQIEAALSEARCDALETDGQTLRRTHADDDAVLAILARAEAM